MGTTNQNVLNKPCANQTQCDEISELCEKGYCACGPDFWVESDRCVECNKTSSCQIYGDHHFCSQGICECDKGYYRSALRPCLPNPKNNNNKALVIGLPVVLACVILAIIIGWWCRKRRNRRKKKSGDRGQAQETEPAPTNQVNMSPRLPSVYSRDYLNMAPNHPRANRNEPPPSYDDTINQEEYNSAMYESIDYGLATTTFQANPEYTMGPDAKEQAHLYENLPDGNPQHETSRNAGCNTLGSVTGQGHSKLEQLSMQI